MDLLKAKNKDEFDRGIQVKKQFNKELEKVDLDLEKLLDMGLNEEITPQEYADAKGILLNRKIELREKLSDRNHSSDNWLELVENFFETCFHAREVMESKNEAEKRDLVQTVGGNLFLRDKKLDFSFNKPYDILLLPQVREDVQAWRESNPQ